MAQVKSGLGRGNSTIKIGSRWVDKIDSRFQPYYMRRFPDVFAEVISIEDMADDRASFRMPRLRPPDPATELGAALGGALRRLELLWGQRELFQQPPWKDLLWRHLRGIWSNLGSVTTLVDSLPEPKRTCPIHGDATLANTLWDRRRNGWVWIDPLDRAYIPHDPLVDLGKIAQSCWGYERILLGETDEPWFDYPTMAWILSHTADEYDYEHVRSWCFVHIMRLIPYQDVRVATIFREMLKDHGF